MQFPPSAIDVLQGGDKMWGICIDVNVLNGALSQAVVEYIIKDNKAIVIAPIDNVVLDISKIREIPGSPQFFMGS